MDHIKKVPAPRSGTGHRRNSTSKPIVSGPRFSRYWPGVALYFAPPPETLTVEAQRYALEYYDVGFQAGLERGWLEGVSSLENEISRQAANAAALTIGPSYVELARRRGEPDRADRAETLLRERGAWPWTL